MVMREIKFRGKRIFNGEWIYGYLVNVKSESYIVEYMIDMSGHLDECSFKVDPNTVGQYTGVKDKNGDEIYEGDIITHDISSSLKGVVTFYNCEWRIMEEDASYGMAQDHRDPFHFIILGNIYENSI